MAISAVGASPLIDRHGSSASGWQGAGTESSSAPTSGSSTGGSFLDQPASTIANDLLAKYQQSTGLSTGPASPTNSVNGVS